LAETILQSSKQDGQITTANTTQYITIGGGLAIGTTEAQLHVTMREAGTLSKLFVRIIANSVNGSSTLRTRKNSANGGMTATIGANATGIFEDTTNSDTIAAGDEVNYQSVPGAATGTYTFTVIGVNYAATTDTVSRLICSVSTTYATASTSWFLIPHGEQGLNTTDASAKHRFRKAGTLRSLFVNIVSNARTTNTLIRSRKNGADGNQLITIGSGVTGLIEDTTNTDTIAVADDVNYSLTTGTGTQNLVVMSIASSFVSTAGLGFNTGGRSTGMSLAISSTFFFVIQGRLNAGNTTEAQVQRTLRTGGTFSEMTFLVTANTITANTIATFRKNTANGNQTFTIGSSATGVFSDSTNTDVCAAADIVDYQVVTGGTGTSINIRQMSTWAALSAAASPIPQSVWIEWEET
jgi:hypothetical protein